MAILTLGNFYFGSKWCWYLTVLYCIMAVWIMDTTFWRCMAFKILQLLVIFCCRLISKLHCIQEPLARRKYWIYPNGFVVVRCFNVIKLSVLSRFRQRIVYLVSKQSGDVTVSCRSRPRSVIGRLTSYTRRVYNVNSIKAVGAFSPASNPGRSNEKPISWRWHANTKCSSNLLCCDV